MKVLLVNHFPLVGSGSGIYVMNIAKSLEQKGHQVCIIMPENTTEIMKIKNVKIHPVYFTREETIEGQLSFNFPCMDPHPRSNFLFNNMTEEQVKQYENAFKKAIEEEIKEFKPDIIHTQHIWIISGLLKDYNIPYIITSHGAEFITYRRTNMFDYCGINATKGCEKIIAISEDNKKEIIERFPEEKDKIILVKNGYNAQDFFMENLKKREILNKFSIDKEYEKIVLFVGRVSKMKGVDVLLKAASMYENENILTLIAGDGDFRSELNEMKEKLGLKNVIFLGNRTQEELRLLYNISTVFVLPSRKEALPLVAIEAMACGTPVVVTNQSGMDKIINKEVGLLFEMDNEKMLAEKIKLVLENKVVFDKQKIANYAKTNYSQESLMKQLLELYEEMRRRKSGI